MSRLYESEERTDRAGIASVFRRIADELEGSGPVAVTDDESVTVDPPAEPLLDIEIDHTDGIVGLEFEIEWEDDEGGVTIDGTDATASEQEGDSTEDESDEENEAETTSNGTFELYEDNAGEWRWRLRHRNGNIIADSGEGYSTKANAKNGIESVKRNAPNSGVEQQ